MAQQLSVFKCFVYFVNNAMLKQWIKMFLFQLCLETILPVGPGDSNNLRFCGNFTTSN